MRSFFLLVILSVLVSGQTLPPGPGFVAFAGATIGVGDMGPAVSASLVYPKALAFDAQGNLYIADFGSARVRKVTPQGIISTVAGTGEFGFTGDGGPAASAEISSPTGLAVDSAGNLYIADGPNSRIRRVSPAGIISTFAGNGDPATLRPWQLAIDSKGNLYAADGDQSNVRKIDPSGAITLVAGNGQMGFSGDGGLATAAMIVAVGVAVDGAGNLLISGFGHIREVLADGTITTLAQGVFFGGGMSVGPDGAIYMADNGGERVLKFAKDGTGMDTEAGTGVYGFSEGCGTAGAPFQRIAKNAELAQPEAAAVNASGVVYITDSGNQRIRKVTPDGLIATVAGPGTGFRGDGGPASAAGLSGPKGLAVDSAGAIYIADSRNNRVRKITTDGLLHTIAGDGGPTSNDDPACFAPNDAFLNNPSAVAVDDGGNVLVADTGNNRIRKVAPDGTVATIAGTGQPGYTGDGGLATAAALNAPTSLAVEAAGNLFLSDSVNNVIREITPEGIIRTVIDGYAGGLAFDAAGNFYYGGSLYVLRKTPGGHAEVVAGTGDYQSTVAPVGPVNSAADVGFAGAIAVGPDGTLAVGDTAIHRVQRVSASCAVDDPGSLTPGGVAYDSMGNLYVSDGLGTVLWQLPAGALPPAEGPTPMLGDLGVFNAASFEVVPPGLGEPPLPTFREPIAPGEILVLHGICMGPSSAVFGRFDANGVLASQLGEAEVTFNDAAAPLLFVQNGQIELIAPYELAGKDTAIMKVTNQGHSTSITVTVTPAMAGIFTVSGTGTGQAAVDNADGTLNSPANPAARGDLIALFATGLGQTHPAGVDGKLVKGLATTVAAVSVTIGGENAKVVFAGDAPGYVGLTQINVIVPQAATPGSAVPVSVVAACNVSAQAATIAIR